LLTANLDNPGYSWTKAPYATLASRPARRLWTDQDGRNLATDQKVGGSSPSERATESPGQRHHALIPEVSFS